MDKHEIVQLIQETGTIAIIRRIGKEHLSLVADALYRGGVKLIEVTCNTPGYIEMIRSLNREWKGRLVVGAGTVLSPELVREVSDAGAEFILAPNMDAEVVLESQRLGKLAIPGVMTPSEIMQAYKLGIDLVKLFPAAALGSRYLKDLRGPLGHIRYMPVGGINKDNMLEFLNAGAFAFGFGSELVDGRLVNEGRFEEISQRARQITTTFSDHNPLS